jgi:hypothetical protein
MSNASFFIGNYRNPKNRHHQLGCEQKRKEEIQKGTIPFADHYWCNQYVVCYSIGKH